MLPTAFVPAFPRPLPRIAVLAALLLGATSAAAQTAPATDTAAPDARTITPAVEL